MITEKDVWIAYKQAKEGKTEIKVPKNWDISIHKRLSNENQRNLYNLMVRFNTIWQNIDPLLYMKIGFSIWKTFSYKHFLNEKIINKYIEFDKRIKRSSKIKEERILKSLHYIYYISNGLKEYSKEKVDGNIHRAVEDYLANRIDRHTISYLIMQGFLQTEDFEKNLIPYIIENFKEIKKELSDNIHVFERFKGETMSDQYKKDYLEKPKKENGEENEEVEETMIYDGDTLKEKKKKKEDYQKNQLNE